MSHSGRRGPAIVAASNHQVSLSDIAHRGKWNLESFATLMEYICETSHSDQKVGRVLGGWENPEFNVHAPTLEHIANSSNEEEHLNKFVAELFKYSLSKLTNLPFARAILATILMYLKDTILANTKHALHVSLINAAKTVFMEDDESILQILLRWGDRIRSKFIMNNLTQLNSTTILDNLSEESIATRFVGAHTFQDVLNKMVAGHRIQMNETLELRGQIMTLNENMQLLKSENEKQTIILNDLANKLTHMHSIQIPSEIENMSSQLPIQHAIFKQPRRWPQSLQSLGGVQLADLIFQFIVDALWKIPKGKNNDPQRQALSAIKIASNFHSTKDISNIVISHKNKPATQQNIVEYRSIANQIQADAVLFIKSKQPDGQRTRGLSGKVLGIIRTWTSLNLDK